MSVILYGISNCDTVKRARAWLAEHGVEAVFHDFKKAGVPPAHLDRWLAAAGWERLLNRKGTAWRKLDDATRDGVVDTASARSVMLEHSSVIKRPVVEWDADTVTVGFDAAQWPSLSTARPLRR
jgi:arsenate reductase